MCLCPKGKVLLRKIMELWQVLQPLNQYSVGKERKGLCPVNWLAQDTVKQERKSQIIFIGLEVTPYTRLELTSAKLQMRTNVPIYHFIFLCSCAIRIVVYYKTLYKSWPEYKLKLIFFFNCETTSFFFFNQWIASDLRAQFL